MAERSVLFVALIAILLAIAVYLSGCATQPDVSPPPAVAAAALPATGCTAWTAAELDGLASTMEPLPETSPVWRVTLEWQRFRDLHCR